MIDARIIIKLIISKYYRPLFLVSYKTQSSCKVVTVLYGIIKLIHAHWYEVIIPVKPLCNFFTEVIGKSYYPSDTVILKAHFFSCELQFVYPSGSVTHLVSRLSKQLSAFEPVILVIAVLEYVSEICHGNKVYIGIRVITYFHLCKEGIDLNQPVRLIIFINSVSSVFIRNTWKSSVRIVSVFKLKILHTYLGQEMIFIIFQSKIKSVIISYATYLLPQVPFILFFVPESVFYSYYATALVIFIFFK